MEEAQSIAAVIRTKCYQAHEVTDQHDLVLMHQP